MTLRRRIPSPTPSLTKIPSSSGPRCTSVLHINWMVCASTPARLVFAIPAIPHIWLSLLHGLRKISLRAPRVSSVLRDAGSRRVGVLKVVPFPQAIIPVIAGAPFLPVARSQDDVDHFTSGNKMKNLVAFCRALHHRLQEILECCTEHRLFLFRIHTVAMQLDKQPVWPIFHRNHGPFPKLQPLQAWRVVCRERTIFYANPTSPARRKCQRALHHERKFPNAATTCERSS